jgi:penicillin amidase
MPRPLLRLLFLCVLAAPVWRAAAQTPDAADLARRALARIDGELRVPGLGAEVRVIRDRWGVPHIYAQSTDDLFFAQGYVAAQDRLWQMELWRREAEGRLAEIAGPRAVDRDRMARLLKYRGPMDDREWTSYHPDARRIMAAFVNGVNAFIRQNADRLPVEFTLTGIRPEPWTIDAIVLRQIAFGDATAELQLARSVAELGAAEANRRRAPDPPDDLKVPDGLDVSIVSEEVLAATRGGRGRALPELLPEYRTFGRPAAPGRGRGRGRGSAGGPPAAFGEPIVEPGSNNWVVSGALSTTGRPVVVNDPHRSVNLPSLRYIVHLNAPGWNVIGSSEPPFLGVAIGHNERLAWGLTIVGTDQHDVYVEELNPANPNEVRWNGRWEALRIVRETIEVKGGAAQVVELKFSRHGPIFYEDRAHHRAYALRSALHEPGTAPYLGGLRLAQARDCRTDFLEAAMYWKAPSENLICGDVDGDISWQASALTPARQGWVGRLPVPGTGKYEWTGFRKDLPREINPSRGFIATANNNVNPEGYWPPLMFRPADGPYARIRRVLQMIAPGRRYSLEDHQRMQHDAHSLRAAADLPLFRGWTADRAEAERARATIASWDAVYAKDSAGAAMYESWRRAGDAETVSPRLAPAERKKLLEPGLLEAVARLTRDLGEDNREWRWGRLHRQAFAHALVPAFDLATVERSGGAGTVAADGATYREILDVSNWDRSLVTNTPGQSGQPESPFYGDLLPLWAGNEYFPLVYSAKAVEAQAAHRLTLKPGSSQ